MIYNFREYLENDIAGMQVARGTVRENALPNHLLAIN